MNLHWHISSRFALTEPGYTMRNAVRLVFTGGNIFDLTKISFNETLKSRMKEKNFK